MPFTPSPCHRLSLLLGPPPPRAWRTLWTAPYYVKLATPGTMCLLSASFLRHFSFWPWLDRERLWVGFLKGHYINIRNEWLKKGPPQIIRSVKAADYKVKNVQLWYFYLIKIKRIAFKQFRIRPKVRYRLLRRHIFRRLSGEHHLLLFIISNQHNTVNA